MLPNSRTSDDASGESFARQRRGCRVLQMNAADASAVCSWRRARSGWARALLARRHQPLLAPQLLPLPTDPLLSGCDARTRTAASALHRLRRAGRSAAAELDREPAPGGEHRVAAALSHRQHRPQHRARKGARMAAAQGGDSSLHRSSPASSCHPRAKRTRSSACGRKRAGSPRARADRERARQRGTRLLPPHRAVDGGGREPGVRARDLRCGREPQHGLPQLAGPCVPDDRVQRAARPLVR